MWPAQPPCSTCSADFELFQELLVCPSPRHTPPVSTPHSLHLLDYPPIKEAFKRLVNAKVLDFWERKLRLEASFIPSLAHFKPEFHSLKSPHRLWTTAGEKPYEVAKARIQLLFLCSQYPCGSRTRHWSAESLGHCSFQPSLERGIVETPEHILLHCPAYTTTRTKMIILCLKIKTPWAHSITVKYLLGNSPKNILQLLLDCSPLPDVILSAQTNGDQVYNDLFYLGRTWCFAIHRERMKRLGRWNFRWSLPPLL